MTPRSVERFEATTNVRFPRSKRWAFVALVPMILLSVALGKFVGIWFFLLPGPLVLFFANRIVRANVVASAEGLRIGQRLVPRSALSSALVRHDHDVTYVSFQGDQRVDVEVTSNVAAEELLRALKLDAASSAVEIPLQKTASPQLRFLPIVAMIVGFLAMRTFHPQISALMIAAAGIAVFVVAMRLALRVTLRVGADGIVFHEALKKERFVSHDAIKDVRAIDDMIVVELNDGQEMTFTLPGSRSSSRESPRDRAHRNDEAEAIVRRVRQARQAYREGANAPELTVALARGSRSVRDWVTELRRLGEGAASTFRTIGIAREQLFDVVESTTAAARDRIAAMVALRATLRDEEKPRIRIAAERIAAPELRERMVRILDAEDEAAVEEELRELDDSKK